MAVLICTGLFVFGEKRGKKGAAVVESKLTMTFANKRRWIEAVTFSLGNRT